MQRNRQKIREAQTIFDNEKWRQRLEGDGDREAARGKRGLRQDGGRCHHRAVRTRSGIESDSSAIESPWAQRTAAARSPRVNLEVEAGIAQTKATASLIGVVFAAGSADRQYPGLGRGTRCDGLGRGTRCERGTRCDCSADRRGSEPRLPGLAAAALARIQSAMGRQRER